MISDIKAIYFGTILDIAAKIIQITNTKQIINERND